jgi:cbb3-type cytochrome oxidase subunit 3
MKIVINALEKIQGVEIYPIISLLIFFSFFIIMAYYVLNLDKGYIDEMKNMPLEEDNDDSMKNNITEEKN